jgi:hypothetical protein
MAPPSVPSPPEPATPAAPDAAEDGAAISYSYKPSLLGSAYAFTLQPEGLSWRAGRRGALWAYDDIAMIRMSYRPVSMQTRRFRTDMWNRSGQHVIVVSTTWRSMALMEPQADAYRAFITDLHRRVGAAGGRVLCEGGLLPWVYHLATLLLGLVAVAMIGLLVRAVVTHSVAGALFLAALMALFAWQIGTFMVRNRPVAYRPDALPAHLMP